MKISIHSRKSIDLLLKGIFPENTAVISFYDPPSKHISTKDYAPIDYKGKTEKIFQIALHDIDYDILKEYDMTYEDYFTEADELAEFIYSAYNSGMDIICQCDYGQSRSAGCAAAIYEHFYKTGIKIFADYKYYPNQMVFNKVFNALENYKKSI